MQVLARLKKGISITQDITDKHIDDYADLIIEANSPGVLKESIKGMLIVLMDKANFHDIKLQDLLEERLNGY